MISWFRKLLQPQSRPAAAAPAPLPDPGPVVAAPQDPDFEGLWVRLNGEGSVAPIPALPEGLADQVVAHFERHHPMPSSFPSLAVRVMDILAQPDVDIQELLRAIEPDPAISAHLIKVANSALYHRGQDVLNLRSAVMRIGVRGVGEIAAGVAGRALFDVALRVEYETFPDRWQALFRATMATAFTASQYAFEQQLGRPDRVFLGGMFQDIGKTLALRTLAQLIISGQAPSDLAPEVVDALLDQVHVPIGLEALGLWGLPDHLVELCAHHHDGEVSGRPDATELSILRLVHAFGRLEQGTETPALLVELREAMETLHLDRVRLRMLRKLSLDQQARIEVLFPE